MMNHLLRFLCFFVENCLPSIPNVERVRPTRPRATAMIITEPISSSFIYNFTNELIGNGVNKDCYKNESESERIKKFVEGVSK